MRELMYVEAVREAHAQLLADDERVFVIGQGLWSPWYVGGSMADLEKEFGRHRIIDCPVSENAVTGVAVGAALTGMRPIVVHPRMDFITLAMDPIVNQAANWSYLFNGQIGVPMVVRPIINRGGEQGAQHSQALHAFFVHVPGLKVVMPATAEDAKGLLISAVRDENPVLYIDDRWLYTQHGPVPEEMYETPIGKASILRRGTDMTIVAISCMVPPALQAADRLQKEGFSIEVIDLRSVKPWDKETVCESVSNTGRLLVADGGWATCGVASEIVANVTSSVFERLAIAPIRVCLPDVPAPTAKSLEDAYYPNADTLMTAVRTAFQTDRPLVNPRPSIEVPGQILFC